MKRFFNNFKKLIKRSQLKLVKVTYSYMKYTKDKNNIITYKESNNNYTCHIFLKDSDIWASTIKELIFQQILQDFIYSASDINIIDIKEIDICERKVIS